MRFVGSLVFLIGALCLGAFAYFPNNTSHYGRLAQIADIKAGADRVGRLPSGDVTPGVRAPRTFSPGLQLLRWERDGRAITASASRLGSTSAIPAAADISPAPSPTLATFEQNAPAAHTRHAWRIVVDRDNSDLRRAAPKRDDYRARYELARNLQTELARVGCYLGDVDGDWGPASKRAAGEFLRKANATLPVDTPDYILLTLIQGHADKACGVDCPNGQGLASNGRCVPTVIVARGSARDKLIARKALATPDVITAASTQTRIAVAAAPTPPLPPVRAPNRVRAPVDTTGAGAGRAVPLAAYPVGVADRSGNRGASVTGAPSERTAPLPGMMAVGAPAPEPVSLQRTPAVAAMAPPPVAVAAAPRDQILPAWQTSDGDLADPGTGRIHDRPSVVPPVGRTHRDTHAQKTRKANEQRRARYEKRGMVRTFSGRVRSGSPQHNLMLSLGGVF